MLHLYLSQLNCCIFILKMKTWVVAYFLLKNTSLLIKIHVITLILKSNVANSVKILQCDSYLVFNFLPYFYLFKDGEKRKKKFRKSWHIGDNFLSMRNEKSWRAEIVISTISFSDTKKNKFLDNYRASIIFQTWTLMRLELEDTFMKLSQLKLIRFSLGFSAYEMRVFIIVLLK